MNIIEKILIKYAEKKIQTQIRKDPNKKPRYRLFRIIGIIPFLFCIFYVIIII
jgi:hypothetical protein